MILYTCKGNVRGSCRIKHRTLRAAIACCRRDQRGCEKVGGYSDREPTRVDGKFLDWSQIREIDVALDAEGGAS